MKHINEIILIALLMLIGCQSFARIGCKDARPEECLQENANEIECFIREHGTTPHKVYSFNGVSVTKFQAETCAEQLKNLRKSSGQRHKEDPNLALP